MQNDDSKTADPNDPPAPRPPNRLERRAAASIARRKTKPRDNPRSWADGMSSRRGFYTPPPRP